MVSLDYSGYLEHLVPMSATLVTLFPREPCLAFCYRLLWFQISRPSEAPIYRVSDLTPNSIRNCSRPLKNAMIVRTSRRSFVVALRREIPIIGVVYYAEA